MSTLLVPCRPGAQAGLPARDAYLSDDGIFGQWRSHVEDDGSPWYVVSTKHGLLDPDAIVPDAYDRRVREAMADRSFLERLGDQLKTAGLRPAICIVIDADWFQSLVAKAFGVEKDEVGLRTGVSPLFHPRP